MEIKQTKIEKATAYMECAVPSTDVLEEKEHVVEEMIKNVAVKGFRVGKAPKNLAEKQLDPQRLTDHMLNHIVSHLVSHAVEENKYRLLGRPALEDIKMEKDGSWIIKLQFPLYPEVKLGEYKKYLKSGSKPKTDEKKEKNIEDVYEKLLKNEKVDVSPLVINEEVQYSLERLASQAKSLNLPIEDYLKALGKTLEQVKQEYADSAEKSVKLDIILLEIAKKEEIDTEDKELLELAKVSSIPESQYYRLRQIINRRKTIDFLMNL